MKRFWIACLTLIVMSACGDSAQKKAEQDTAKGEERKAEILRLMNELEAEGVAFGANSQEEDPAIELMKLDELNKNTPKLDRLVAAIGEYVAFLNRDDVKVTGMTKDELRTALSSIGVKAGKHLRFARVRLTKLQTETAKPAKAKKPKAG